MKQVEKIEFIDEATGGRIAMTVYSREDLMILIDIALPERPATAVSLPPDIAKRFAEAIVRAISASA